MSSVPLQVPQQGFYDPPPPGCFPAHQQQQYFARPGSYGSRGSPQHHHQNHQQQNMTAHPQSMPFFLPAEGSPAFIPKPRDFQDHNSNHHLLHQQQNHLFHPHHQFQQQMYLPPQQQQLPPSQNVHQRQPGLRIPSRQQQASPSPAPSSSTSSSPALNMIPTAPANDDFSNPKLASSTNTSFKPPTPTSVPFFYQMSLIDRAYDQLARSGSFYGRPPPLGPNQQGSATMYGLNPTNSLHRHASSSANYDSRYSQGPRYYRNSRAASMNRASLQRDRQQQQLFSPSGPPLVTGPKKRVMSMDSFGSPNFPPSFGLKPAFLHQQQQQQQDLHPRPVLRTRLSTPLLRPDPPQAALSASFHAGMAVPRGHSPLGPSSSPTTAIAAASSPPPLFSGTLLISLLDQAVSPAPRPSPFDNLPALGPPNQIRGSSTSPVFSPVSPTSSFSSGLPFSLAKSNFSASDLSSPVSTSFVSPLSTTAASSSAAIQATSNNSAYPNPFGVRPGTSPITTAKSPNSLVTRSNSLSAKKSVRVSSLPAFLHDPSSSSSLSNSSTSSLSSSSSPSSIPPMPVFPTKYAAFEAGAPGVTFSRFGNNSTGSLASTLSSSKQTPTSLSSPSKRLSTFDEESFDFDEHDAMAFMTDSSFSSDLSDDDDGLTNLKDDTENVTTTNTTRILKDNDTTNFTLVSLTSASLSSSMAMGGNTTTNFTNSSSINATSAFSVPASSTAAVTSGASNPSSSSSSASSASSSTSSTSTAATTAPTPLLRKRSSFYPSPASPLPTPTASSASDMTHSFPFLHPHSHHQTHPMSYPLPPSHHLQQQQQLLGSFAPAAGSPDMPFSDRFGVPAAVGPVGTIGHSFNGNSGFSSGLATSTTSFSATSETVNINNPTTDAKAPGPGTAGEAGSPATTNNNLLRWSKVWGNSTSTTASVWG